MGMAEIGDLVIFGATFAVVCFYALTVAGMFPAEHRPATLKTTPGQVLLYGTLAFIAVLAVHLASFAFGRIPWYFVIIVAGLIVLFAPGLHQNLPGTLRDGRIGLAVFAAAGGVAHVALWMSSDVPAAATAS